MKLAIFLVLILLAGPLAAERPEAKAWYDLANRILELSDGPAIEEVKTCDRQITDTLARIRATPTGPDRELHEAALVTWQKRKDLAVENLASVNARQMQLFGELRDHVLPAFVAHSDFYAGRIAGHNWSRQLNIPLERELGRTAQQALRLESVYIRGVIAQIENAKALNAFRPQVQSASSWRQRLASVETAMKDELQLWHREGTNNENLVNHKQCLQFLTQLSAVNLRIAQYEVELDERSPSAGTIRRMQSRLAETDRELNRVLQGLNAGRATEERELYRQAAILADEINLLESLLTDKTRPLTPKATQGVHRDLRTVHRQREAILAQIRHLKNSRWRAGDPPRR